MDSFLNSVFFFPTRLFSIQDISEYFPLFGRTHLLFASITTAWRDDSAMNDSHQHGRTRRQFSILQQKAGTREEETYVCSFHRYY